MTYSECVSDSVKQANEQLRLEKRGEGALWSHWMKVCNSLEWRFSSWTTFLFPYLRLVPLTSSFLCCFWQHVVLHTLPRLCRLDNTLLPVSPLLPQGTTTHTGQNEGNGFDFLPLFTHQMGTENEERTLVLTELDKQTHATACVCVCVYAHICISVSFKMCVLDTV